MNCSLLYLQLYKLRFEKIHGAVNDEKERSLSSIRGFPSFVSAVADYVIPAKRIEALSRV